MKEHSIVALRRALFESWNSETFIREFGERASPTLQDVTHLWRVDNGVLASVITYAGPGARRVLMQELHSIVRMTGNTIRKVGAEEAWERYRSTRLPYERGPSEIRILSASSFNDLYLIEPK